jgi:hypothetical protein
MALFPRVRLRAVCLHVRDTLRSGLNSQITQCIAETPASAPATNLATIADTTAQIVFADDFDYEPYLYPSIRVANPRVAFMPLGSASVTTARLLLTVGVYTEQIADGSTECAADVIPSLSETTLDLVECVRATIERDYPSNLYGSQIRCTLIERVDAPQDPENPCSMRQKFEIQFEANTPVRQSRGALT